MTQWLDDILDRIRAGESRRKIARNLGLDYDRLAGAIRLHEDMTGETLPRESPGRPSILADPERVQKIAREYRNIPAGGIHRFCAKQGISYTTLQKVLQTCSATETGGRALRRVGRQ